MISGCCLLHLLHRTGPDPGQILIDDGTAACVEDLEAVQVSRARRVRIGNGLAAGRRKYSSHKLYGQWIKTMPFKNIDWNSRADAIWLLSEPLTVDLPADMANPTVIRQWVQARPTVGPVSPAPSLDAKLAVAGLRAVSFMCSAP